MNSVREATARRPLAPPSHHGGRRFAPVAGSAHPEPLLSKNLMQNCAPTQRTAFPVPRTGLLNARGHAGPSDLKGILDGGRLGWKEVAAFTDFALSILFWKVLQKYKIMWTHLQGLSQNLQGV